jgi:hypothetical protein
MNIILLFASLIMVFCTFLSNKLKRKVFGALTDDQQSNILLVNKPSKYNLVIFFGCIMVSVIYMILPFTKIVSPFIIFLILMFVYIITNMFLKIQKLRTFKIDQKFINVSLQANIIVLIGLSIFAFAFLWSNYTWV